MLGLPLGVALSYLVGGYVAQHYGWRAVFWLAGLPGLVLAAIILFQSEPARGRSEQEGTGIARRMGNPAKLIMSIPTMRWIVLSGMLHNFVMYAFTFFLPSFLVRYHGTSVQMAGLLSAVLIGTVGALGMLAGGWFGDVARQRWLHGRMTFAGIAVLLAVPSAFCALWMPSGSLIAFIAFQASAAFLMYTYYPLVYATIHDIIEPVLRGRALAMYFFAMYMLGASMGPVATGWLSDFFARNVARGLPVSEHARALGLHHAMYLIPALTLVLAAILFAGAVTAGKDTSDLQNWIKSLNAEGAEGAEKS
jgi:MFS family permease